MKLQVVLFIIVLGMLSCSKETRARSHPNVILICLDTVRADHLGCYGYDERDTSPFLDRIAEEALLFESASATACWTKPSVPSILTGTLPLQHGVYRGSARGEAGSFSDVLPDEAFTLAEAFSASGYQTAAFVRNAQLRSGLGFEQGFDEYIDRAGDAREIRWRARDWLDERDVDRPFFLYLHMLDAHWPYSVPAEYASRFTEMEVVDRIQSGDWRTLRDAVNHGEKTMSTDDLVGLVALYDGAIRYMDDEIGRLWKKLEHEGLAENTILCVVSDHGEEFLEHGRLGHGHGLYEHLLHVPWILRTPSREHERFETPVSLLDLFPTLLSAAGIGSGSSIALGTDRTSEPSLATPAIAEHLDPNRYQISWREGSIKHVDIVEPERSASDADHGLVQLDPRGRWEARLRVDESGAHWLTRLRPAKDQEEEQFELKGVITELGDGTIQIEGLPVDLRAVTEFYGEPMAAATDRGALGVGQMIKVRGVMANGILRAEKVKLYKAEDEPELELRGPLEVISAELLTMAGISVRVGADAQLDLSRASEDIGPEDVIAIYAGRDLFGSESAQVFDLEHDPEEVRALSTSQTKPLQEQKLDMLRSILNTRFWGSNSRRKLSESEMKDLRAIGYAE